VKGAGLQRVQIPPGNWFAPPGSNRSGGGGNKPVKQPVLLLNGHYDFFFPERDTQVHFYNLLGSRKDEKKRIVYDTGHAIPHNELIKETLNWLDLYLGPTS
jgi:hypothetical protein